MDTARDDLFRQALQLTEAERAELAELLLESIEPPLDPEIEKAWLAEAERRLAEIESGACQPIPWEQVMARVRRRITGE
jgi:putative addiction module component (TIGR02574 family)